MSNKHNMFKKAESLAKDLSLKDIYLQEVNCSRCKGQPPKKGDISLEVNSKFLQSDEGIEFPFGIKFTVKAVDKDSSSIAFQIDAEFVVVYNAKEGITPTNESVEAFGITSVVFNAWPYAREFFQNTLARMKLPQFFLPPLRMSELAKISAKAGNEEKK